MTGPASPVGAALQATLTADLIKTLSSALATGSVTDAPASIQNSSTPLAISGTLVSQLSSGGAVVQTAAGPVTLALDQPTALPQGTLTVLIQPGNPPTASIIANQTVTPQAQIVPQATAAQQTQDIQTAPALALPPLTVGQVLTATPLPSTAPIVVGPNAPVQATLPTPVVGAAASSAAVTAAIQTELPIAVLLNSAIPPAPGAPPANFVKPEVLLVDGVEPSPAEEAVGQDGGQGQIPASFLPQAQNPDAAAISLQAAGAGAFAEEEEIAPLTPQANALAAQESVNEETPPLAYNPGVTVPPAAPATTQSFVVLGITPAPSEPASGSTSLSAPLEAQALHGQTITATVLGQTSTGQPLLGTSGGALLVNQAVATTIGSEITLQRLTPEQAAAQAPAGPATQAQTGPAGPLPLNDVPLAIARQQTWPALAQLLTTLGSASPQAASYISQAIPTLASGGFAQAFTAFLTQGSQASSSYGLALGPVIDRSVDPQELRAALLQLGADLTTIASKASASLAPQSWQSHQVPILTDYGLTMAQLFTRSQIDPVDDETGKPSAKSSTRFLVEISPSQLGPVQLDGLLRKTQTRIDRLDLIVRSEFAISPQAGQDMQTVFQGTLGATGMTGSLGFQTGAETFVLPHSDGDSQYRNIL